MLLDSIEHAEDDMQHRQLREQRVEAERILAEADRQLTAHADLLDAQERAVIDAAVAEVKRAAAADDHLAVKERISALDEASRPFIERVMNRALSQAVAGHSVEEY